MTYRTKTYIAGDWTGDQDLISQLYSWNNRDDLRLSFTDAHELTQARDTSLPCSIKRSLAERLDASKTFVLIVGKDTDKLTKGSCRYCGSYDSYHISKLISLSSYLKTMVCSYNPTKFEETDYVDTVLDVNNKLRHTNYPVVNKDNKCLGLLRITDLNDKAPKRVILVDHSEKLQSADGIEQAKIVEIVDHHNIGSITTDAPINYRNMAVGSSNTINYILYKENNVEIPKHIAGMMLSGILSDTLILKSPTTTDTDREVVKELSKIAGVNYEEYGMEMLKAGTSLEGMSIEDVLYNDYKLYNVGDNTFAIGQFFTMNFEDINKDIDKYIKVMNDAAEANNYKLVVLYVTDIIKNGSYIIFNDKGKDVISEAYNKEMNVGDFIEKCVSRKKNVVPLIMDTFGN